MITVTEFHIICVVNSTNPSHIHHVGVYSKNSKPIKHPRSTVINNIDAGHTYYTWFFKNKKWNKGSQVQKTPDGKFITTNPNNTIKDNLGDLPDCRKI